MVLVGTPRSETNREGGDRIVLRSKHSNLNLRHTCSILSIKIEVVEMGSTHRHPKVLPTQRCPSTRPSSTLPAVGTGKRGSGPWRRRHWPCVGSGGHPSSDSQGGEGVSTPGVDPRRRATCLKFSSGLECNAPVSLFHDS